jgi:excisionase family DNA binding protein
MRDHESPDDLLTVADLARKGQNSKRYWRERIWNGELAVVKIGRLIRVQRHEFERYVAEHTVSAAS